MALGIVWASVLLSLFLALLTADRMGFFRRKNHFHVEGRTVLLTGGSQGMGRGLGRLLSQKGANVVIVARNRQKLDEALQYISAAAKSPSTQRFHAISADVTSAEENTRILEETTVWNAGHPPDVVWANAGVSVPTLFIDTPLETLRSQMEINYWAATYLAHATLRLWLRPSSSTDTDKNNNNSRIRTDPLQRHFILTSSTAAFCGLAGYSPYSPPKAALRSLADNLQSELNLYNGHRSAHRNNSNNDNDKDAVAVPGADVKIHCVVPGTITSPGHAAEQALKHPITKELEASDPAQSEDEVAAAAIRGLEAGGFLVATQWLGKAMRAGMLGGSKRDGWGVWDAFVGGVVGWVWLVVGPDMEGKVWEWGRKGRVGLPE